MSLTYRRDIDGLRAIAVSAVVLYHAGFGAAGFVGVDVFFVISGYLITALLLAERATTGQVDLTAFYARRVRRIFPAAIAVIVAVLVLARLLLPAQASTQVFQSAAAAALFVANLFFQSLTSGYFNADTGQLPVPPPYFFSSATSGGREAGIVRDLRRHPPDWIVMISRDLRDFGVPRYGERAGQGKAILDWASSDYEIAATLGGDQLDPKQRGVLVLAPRQ